MDPRMRSTVDPLFYRRVQGRLDARIETGYGEASRQAAGALDGIPLAQEKTIFSLAAPKAFMAQNKVPSCLPEAMPAAGASSPPVLNARFYPCILVSVQARNFSVLFG